MQLRHLVILYVLGRIAVLLFCLALLVTTASALGAIAGNILHAVAT